jgi:exopolysaccharide production protein ExoZ
VSIATGKPVRGVLVAHSTQARAASAELDSIQALRALAALLIFAHHTLRELVLHTGAAPPVIALLYPIAFGGVHIFFVISGFLMMYTMRSSQPSLRSAGHFLIRRFARVAPLYWIFTILFIIVSFVMSDHVRHSDFTLYHILSSFMFFPVQNNLGAFHPVYGVGWTINYDMYFYLIFALFLIFPRFIGLAGLTVFVCFLVAVGVFMSAEWGALWYWTRPILFDLLAGVLVGSLFISRSKPLFGRRVFSMLCITAVIWWLIALPPLDLAGPGASAFSSQDAVLHRGIPAAILIAALTLGERGSTGSTSQGVVLIKRAVLAIGAASYSLSMSHLFMLRALTLIFPSSFQGSAYYFAYIGAAMLLAVPTTFFTWTFFEKPSVALSRRVLGGKRKGE